MYRYDDFDRAFLAARVAEFRDQVERRLAGDLTEEQFRPLRLMNGLYLQLHAYMLRVAIPYGTLSTAQMRRLAEIGRRYDRGYGHFTTRQNIQFNWIALKDAPAILEALAEVDMHAIQTSGNCIRNVTSDPYAGAAADEIADPRPYAEILRQWSSLHPEFSFLPRKFKIAITGADHDRAAIAIHDIGIRVKRDGEGRLGFEIAAGGGLGRSPFLAFPIFDFVAEADLLAACEAILRVYNLYGRRDNKYKARIKILIHESGLETFRSEVLAEFAAVRDGALKLDRADVERIARQFAPPALTPRGAALFEAARATDPAFAAFAARNLNRHRVPGWASLTISLKPVGGIPGDATSDQMDAVADLADRYAFGEVRVTHQQNLVFTHVALDDLPAIHARLVELGLAEANVGLVTDIIACPGLDYCALANARSIPIAQAISERLAPRQAEIGPLSLKISGCINACGHHHVGGIGILGVDKKGAENYQLLLGGSAENDAALADLTGPGFDADGIVDAVATVTDVYLRERLSPAEDFVAAYRRLGLQPFKEALYAAR